MATDLIPCLCAAFAVGLGLFIALSCSRKADWPQVISAWLFTAAMLIATVVLLALALDAQGVI